MARKYNVSPNTIYRWRQKYKGLSSSEAKCLKAFEQENARLKKFLAEKELEIQTLTEFIKKLLTLRDKCMLAKKLFQLSKHSSKKPFSKNSAY
ncbi:MAG TPA: hypothetical protein ENG63_01325 [Candidatus Desulfofervidus auxilii]|uniref:Transposase n=1 Tax=Desulfofervidus auxilii TaxID=1621989 RepID=A0A7C0Y868_DESA2|nr:hypothetical protein [Candidatus Desulfofervidus auxilii]